jgi:hypothetical protein
MMADAQLGDMEPRDRRRLIAASLLRSFLTAAVLVTLYYVAPVDGAWRLSAWLRLIVGSVVFVVVVVWEILRIIRSEFPGIRAIEALAATVPLFLLLFASTYFLMSTFGTGNFSQEDLTRTDALYFTVTVFSTVGFGDITATSETARLVVAGQMILDLIILGFGINAFMSAAKVGRKRRSGSSGE